jgi:hypothetical protein
VLTLLYVVVITAAVICLVAGILMFIMKDDDGF